MTSLQQPDPWRGERPVVDGAAAFIQAMGLGRQDLLRTLQRLHAELNEYLDAGCDDDEPVDDALVACVQLGPPLRTVGPSPFSDQYVRLTRRRDRSSPSSVWGGR